MDDMTVEIDQYEVTAPPPIPEDDEEYVPEPEKFEFIPAPTPELAQTQTWVKPEEAVLQDSDVRQQATTFEMPTHDPLSEVAEPVPIRKGNLYAPGVSTQMDSDLQNLQDPSAIDLPDLPDFGDEETTGPFANQDARKAAATQATSPTPMAQSPSPAVPAVSAGPAVQETPDLPDFDDDFSEVQPTVAPVKQFDFPEGQIWPWPAGENLPMRQLQNQLIPAFEDVQHGRIEQANAVLDSIGPHLGDSIELVYHIGLLMQQLGRNEQLQWMLEQAKLHHPESEPVRTAVAHLV